MRFFSGVSMLKMHPCTYKIGIVRFRKDKAAVRISDYSGTGGKPLKKSRIYISEFEAEERLRREDSYSLPALSLFARRNDLLLEGMDALTITMAEEGDILVTRVPLPDPYLRWWEENFCRVTNISPAPVLNESGAEAVVPLDRLWKQMDKTLSRNIGNGATVYNTFNVTADDPALFANEVARELQQQLRMG